MRATRRRTAVVALAAALALGACGGASHRSTTKQDTSHGAGSRASEPRHGGKVTWLWRDDVDSLDPGVTYVTSGFVVAHATQRPLLGFPPGDAARAVPDLAAAPPAVSRDGRTVTVRLRTGVRFSPPVDRSVTSRDVKYAIERGFFRTVANGYAGAYFGDVVGAKPGVDPGATIAGIQTPDDRTVVFRLTRSTGRLLVEALTMPLSAPVPRAFALPYDRQQPSTYGMHQVATGPYMVELDRQGRTAGYVPGLRITLVRNPNWDRTTDTKPAYLDTIEIRQGNDDAALATRRILRGHDMVSGDFNPPPAELKRALTRDRDQVALPSANGTRYVTLNTRLKPFDNVDVRRAVVAGFDRQAMRLTGGGSSAATLATHFIPPGTPGFAEAGGANGPALDFLARPDGDLGLAARYLRKAGYASGRYDGGGQILMIGVSGGNDERAAEVAQEDLARLGFKVRLRLVTMDVMATKFCGTPSAHVQVCPNIFWVRDFADAQTMLDPTFNGHNILPNGNVNISELDVPAINDAMAKARLIVDPTARAKAWGAIDRMVTAQAAAVPVSWDRYPLVRSADVVGVVSQYLGQFDPTFTWVK
jgi:peptide/nickel transport system substrate-binding protein